MTKEQTNLQYTIKKLPLAEGYLLNTIRKLATKEQGYLSTQYPLQTSKVFTARSEEWNKNKQRVGGYVVGTFQPPGEPLKQVLVPLSVGRGLFSIGDLSIQPSLRSKNFERVGGGGKTFDGTAPTIT